MRKLKGFLVLFSYGNAFSNEDKQEQKYIIPNSSQNKLNSSSILLHSAWIQPSRGCKPRENLWNCSRKHAKMFKTDLFFRQQKIEFKPMSGTIMLLCNKILCCIFWGFFTEMRPNYWEIILLSSSRAFLLSTSTFLFYPPLFYSFGQQWGYPKRNYKKQQNST
jgi:hypothetical protein